MHLKILRNAAHLLRLRVREQPVQELLAMFGIATGVALLFAAQVASSSVTTTVEDLARGISGRASLELSARGPDGMRQQYFDRVQKQPAVKVAAPVLLQRITITGPDGTQPLTLVGVDQRLERIGGPLARRFIAKQGDLDALGLFLTASTAESIGASRGDMLSIQSRGKRRQVLLADELGAVDIGALAKSPIALAPLGQAQRLVNMSGRISRVLVEPRIGQASGARLQLQRIANNKLDVRPSDAEATLLSAALKTDQRSSLLFSLIAVLIGMLFAFNAMLLTSARRHRLTAYLRMLGADRATAIATLVLEALVLGAIASLVGIALGYLLLTVAFHAVPDYLASAFPIGAQHAVQPITIALSLLGGMLATFAASIGPAVSSLRASPGESMIEQSPKGNKAGRVHKSTLFVMGLLVLIATSIVAFLWPALTLIGVLGVFGGLTLMLGPLVSWTMAAVNRVTRVRGGIGLSLAVEELAANPARAAAIALIAAGAMAATLGIGGARLDLQRGVQRETGEFFGARDLWITPKDSSNVYVTQSFDPRAVVEQLNKQPSSRAVHIQYGSFQDIGRFRIRFIGSPADGPRPLARSQILSGNYQVATRRLRSGGWVALSRSVANSFHLGPGDVLSIPTPSGVARYRIAAITANYGWPSGNIVMNADDYANRWGRSSASAIFVHPAPGESLTETKRSVENMIGPDAALSVRTSKEMVADRVHTFRQGLARLGQISILVLGAAIMAITSAMFAAVWQRRRRLASLRAIGLYRGELYRTLFVETSLIVFLGGLAGIAFGLYGQIFASRWTEITSDYYLPFKPAIGLGLVTLAEFVVLAALATIGPAYLASRIEPQTGENT